MTKEEIAELIDQMPQGMDADNYIYELVNRALSVEREIYLKVCEDAKQLCEDAKFGVNRCIDVILKRQKQNNDLLSRSIKDAKYFSLQKRSINGLRAEGIETIGELCNKYEYEIKRIPNLGKLSFNDIVKALAEHGLSLKEKNT